VSIDYKAQAQALTDMLVERRRDFHRHPELAFEEVRTAGIVASELSELGLEVQTGVGKTGVVGILEGDTDGPTVLVRADMDALPIVEDTNADYASTVDGKMHACGHDGHTAIALGVAKIFAENRTQLAGRIKFVFQPAEEIVAGARAMVDDGVLDTLRPDVTLGLHLWNTMPLGVLGVADGPVMAGGSNFTITIEGKGSHAALPQASADPVVTAAQLILALQTIVSRNVDPMETAVLSVTMLKGSDAHNIIPERVELKGTFRTFTKEVSDYVGQRMREISESLCAAMGCKAKVDIRHGTIPTINHPEVAARVRERFAPIVGEANLKVDERTMGSEDVAYFMDDIPGMFFFVGSANDDKGLNYGHHHPRFDFDEAALPLAVELLASAVGSYVITE